MTDDGLSMMADLDAMTAWQRELLRTLLEGGEITPASFAFAGRRAAKADRTRALTLAAVASAALGEHVHYAEPGGLWGIQITGIGPLWIRLPLPERGPGGGDPIYDELKGQTGDDATEEA